MFLNSHSFRADDIGRQAHCPQRREMQASRQAYERLRTPPSDDNSPQDFVTLLSRTTAITPENILNARRYSESGLASDSFLHGPVGGLRDLLLGRSHSFVSGWPLISSCKLHSMLIHLRPPSYRLGLGSHAHRPTQPTDPVHLTGRLASITL